MIFISRYFTAADIVSQKLFAEVTGFYLQREWNDKLHIDVKSTIFMKCMPQENAMHNLEMYMVLMIAKDLKTNLTKSFSLISICQIIDFLLLMLDLNLHNYLDTLNAPRGNLFISVILIFRSEDWKMLMINHASKNAEERLF